MKNGKPHDVHLSQPAQAVVPSEIVLEFAMRNLR
jgi:hypothetical protein